MDELLSLCTEQPQLSQKLALAFIGKSHFRQTTQNYRNLSPLMCHRAAIFRLALSSLEPLMNYEFPTPVSAGKKIRYGIILKHLIQDPETIGALSYFEFAHALDIEVIIFVCKDATQPGFVERVRAVSNQIMSLPAALPSAIETLRKADLDILFYANDVTAKPSLPALLTFFRVARRTFTCVSTIATTQAPFVDAYMGGKYFHEMGYAGEFSERFISRDIWLRPLSRRADWRFCKRFCNCSSMRCASAMFPERAIFSIWSSMRCRSCEVIIRSLGSGAL
jgi:hypothetical protein